MTGATTVLKGDHEHNPEIDFVSGEFWGGDPHRGLTWLREHAPVYWDGRAWGVSTYADVRYVSLHPEKFSNAGGIRVDNPGVAMMIDMDDPEHMKRRKLVNRGFTPRRVRDKEPDIRAACTGIVDAICERGTADAVLDIAAWLPVMVIGDALGFPREDLRKLLDWSDDLMRGLSGTPEGQALAVDAFIGFQEFCLDAIAARRADPTDDLLSVLVNAEVDGNRFDDDSLVHDALLILIGGDETTRHVISGGLYELLRDRDQWEALRADPSGLPVAIEEMLRWVSPIKNMARTIVEDTTLGDQRLEAGDKLVLLYPSANRDAAVFGDPDRFDSRRTPNDHLAFGLGSHFCLGASLARLELTCMFETLLSRLPDIELVDDAEPANRAANFVSGYESMPVRFTPSAPVGSGVRPT
jgi:cytochrome P450 family 142 subfamily A polypeptide 1